MSFCHPRTQFKSSGAMICASGAPAQRVSRSRRAARPICAVCVRSAANASKWCAQSSGVCAIWPVSPSTINRCISPTVPTSDGTPTEAASITRTALLQWLKMSSASGMIAQSACASAIRYASYEVKGTTSVRAAKEGGKCERSKWPSRTRRLFLPPEMKLSMLGRTVLKSTSCPCEPLAKQMRNISSPASLAFIASAPASNVSASAKLRRTYTGRGEYSAACLASSGVDIDSTSAPFIIARYLGASDRKCVFNHGSSAFMLP
mmetsp:Transcript_18384/g.29694  ORF Transcript_18384/g.29694 Transcript_18384/m.29694 type:complete len:262 (+) Transcript_18384:2482-3267(+)